MFDKTGERQRVFLQHCKNIVVFLEDINLMLNFSNLLEILF